MSGAALVQRPPRPFVDPPSKLGSAGVRRPSESSGGGRLTLEQKLDRVWEGLHAAGAQAECPVCQCRMAGEGAAAKCRGCGSTLA